MLAASTELEIIKQKVQTSNEMKETRQCEYKNLQKIHGNKVEQEQILNQETAEVQLKMIETSNDIKRIEQILNLKDQEQKSY